MKRLTEGDKESYDTIVAALKKRFEPECRKEVYMAEFQRRKKQRTEDWASFGEDLRTLVEKAYPSLQTEAQELLALNHFLSEITDPQLAFGVRQRTPATLDAAVAATLELESYLHKPGLTIASLDDTPDGGDVIAAASKPSSASIETSLQKLLERMDKLEVKLGATKEYNPGRGHQPSRGRDEDRGRSRNKKKLVCWKCKQEGHFARNCTTTSADQGNAKPLGQ